MKKFTILVAMLLSLAGCTSSANDRAGRKDDMATRASIQVVPANVKEGLHPLLAASIDLSGVEMELSADGELILVIEVVEYRNGVRASSGHPLSRQTISKDTQTVMLGISAQRSTDNREQLEIVHYMLGKDGTSSGRCTFYLPEADEKLAESGYGTDFFQESEGKTAGLNEDIMLMTRTYADENGAVRFFDAESDQPVPGSPLVQCVVARFINESPDENAS